MTNNYILETKQLTKSFKGFTAVDDVDLRVEQGSIHGLLGPNGAGKSTCFNLLSKFLKPTSGSIFFKQRDVTHLNPADIANLGVARSFQISAVFPALSVLENVRIAVYRQRRGASLNFWRSRTELAELNERSEELLAQVGLLEYRQRVAANLSYGRKRALEIATTLALEPELLLLDEPMAGMAEHDVHAIAALLKVVARGRTILLVEHNLSVVADLCDQVTVLTRGAVLAEGSYEDVARDPRVVEAYIGAGDE